MLDQWCLSKINLNTRLEFKISAFESLTVYRFQYLSDRLSLDDFSKCLEFHYPTQGTTKVLSISPGPVERPQGCALAEPSGPLLAPNFCSRATRKSQIFIQIICWAPQISQVQITKLPSIFIEHSLGPVAIVSFHYKLSNWQDTFAKIIKVVKRGLVGLQGCFKVVNFSKSSPKGQVISYNFICFYH